MAVGWPDRWLGGCGLAGSVVWSLDGCWLAGSGGTVVAWLWFSWFFFFVVQLFKFVFSNRSVCFLKDTLMRQTTVILVIEFQKLDL